MSIWNEPLTKAEYLRRLVEAKAEQRRLDAALPFDEKVEIVLALQETSRALRAASPSPPVVSAIPRTS
jgi:hypothetical protein